MFKKFDVRIHYEKVSRTPDIVEAYCMKEEGRLDGPYEFGTKPVRRSVKTDWDEVFDSAKTGALDKIPSSVML